MTITVNSSPAKIGLANLFRLEVVASQAGDVAVIPTDGLYRVAGTNNFGLVFQATGSAVGTAFTLDNPQQAVLDPASVTWTAGATIAAGDLKIQQEFAGSAIKLTFVAAGRCMVAAN